MKRILLLQSTCFLTTPLPYIYRVEKKECKEPVRDCFSHDKWSIPKQPLFATGQFGNSYYAEERSEKVKRSFPYVAKQTSFETRNSKQLWKEELRKLQNPLLEGKVAKIFDSWIYWCKNKRGGMIVEKRYRGNLSTLCNDSGIQRWLSDPKHFELVKIQILDLLETFQEMGIMYPTIKPEHFLYEIEYDSLSGIIGVHVVASHLKFLLPTSQEEMKIKIDDWKKNADSLLKYDSAALIEILESRIRPPNMFTENYETFKIKSYQPKDKF